MEEPRKEDWEEMLGFMATYYPELFYSSMSAMYNNPETNPSILNPPPDRKKDPKDILASDLLSSNTSEPAPVPPPPASGAPEPQDPAGKLFAALGIPSPKESEKEDKGRQYKVVVEVEYDPEYDKVVRGSLNGRRTSSYTANNRKKSRKNAWDDN